MKDEDEPGRGTTGDIANGVLFAAGTFLADQTQCTGGEPLA